MPHSTDPIDSDVARSLRRTAFTSMVGTSIEFYDFFIFATAAALVFPTVFFPDGVSPLVALIASFSTFAIGFFARPVGAAVFGHFGDRIGRKRMLVLALLLMGGSTTLIGLLPSAILSCDREPRPIAADFAAFSCRASRSADNGAGRCSSSLENCPPADRRGWYGSFAQVGAPIGTILRQSCLPDRLLVDEP